MATQIPSWMQNIPVKDPALLEATLAFLQNLSPEDKVAVIYDDDGDGISAAGVTVKAITQIRGKRPEYIHRFPHTSGTFIVADLPEQLRNLGVTKLITLDKSVDQMGEEFLQRLGKACSTLVIDHHRVPTKARADNVIISKPDLIWETESSSFPTAVFAYSLFSYLADISPHKWISCIGIISDAAYPRWKDFVDEELQKWKYPITPIPFENAFGKISEIIYATGAISSYQLPEVLDAILEAEEPQTILDSGFTQLVGIMNEELSFWMEKVPQEMQRFPELELNIAKVKPRYNVKSILVNKLSNEMPNQALLLMEEFDKKGLEGKILISARRQDKKVPMNEMLAFATKDLPEANGGGHVPAAGGIIRAQDEAVFLERVKEFLRAHFAS